MTLLEKISIIMSAVTFIGMIFGVYLYFRNPQEKSEINDAVFDEKIKSILDKFDTRFQDMKEGVVKIMQNDLQEVKSDVREHVKNQIINEREVATKLGIITTLLEERLPRK